MKIVVNKSSEAHNGDWEMHHGKMVPCFENPSRLKTVLNALKQSGFGTFETSQDFGLEPIQRIHTRDYLTFLQTIWPEWKQAGNSDQIIPYIWPAPGLKRHPNSGQIHSNLNAKIGTYAFSSDTPIVAGTWQAAYDGAQTALSALALILRGEGSAFALTRPPGHHAHAELYGGYCFLNNAAIAAQFALDNGKCKVCILDVDYHHGNGTQDIFYERPDVLTISLHGDPQQNFPYYLGYSDETGTGAGTDCNINIPLANGTNFHQWSQHLQSVIPKIQEYGAELLIVSLGVDTFSGDPISQFTFKSYDYLSMGKEIAQIGLPTLFTMEGGYDIAPIGQNVLNVLQAYKSLA